MISPLKLSSFGVAAVVCLAGLWHWTHLPNVQQTNSLQSAAFPSALPISQHAQAAPSLSAGTVSELAPKVSGSLNWGMYSGTMQDQVQKALTERDGPMAADLAAKLQECYINGMQLQHLSSHGDVPIVDAGVKAVRTAQLQEYQRQISACQAISGDQKQIRLQLLAVAVEQKVIGAAEQSFAAGVRAPDVLKQMVGDAKMGNLSSLYYVATYGTTLLGIDVGTQSAVRYALKTASADPTAGSRIGDLLKHSELLAPGFDLEKTSTYDYSKMSEAARKEGTEISARLVKQLTNPTS